MNSTIVFPQPMRNATSFVMSASDSKWHFNFAKGIDEKLPKKRGKLTESLAHKNSAIRFAGHGTFKIRWTEQLTLCYDHYSFTLTIISIRKFLQPPRENIVGFSHYHFKTFSWVHSKDRKKLPSYLCLTCWLQSSRTFTISFCVMFASTQSIG